MKIYSWLEFITESKFGFLLKGNIPKVDWIEQELLKIDDEWRDAARAAIFEELDLSLSDLEKLKSKSSFTLYADILYRLKEIINNWHFMKKWLIINNLKSINIIEYQEWYKDKKTKGESLFDPKEVIKTYDTNWSWVIPDDIRDEIEHYNYKVATEHTDENLIYSLRCGKKSTLALIIKNNIIVDILLEKKISPTGNIIFYNEISKYLSDLINLKKFKLVKYSDSLNYLSSQIYESIFINLTPTEQEDFVYSSHEIGLLKMFSVDVISKYKFIQALSIESIIYSDINLAKERDLTFFLYTQDNKIYYMYSSKNKYILMSIFNPPYRVRRILHGEDLHYSKVNLFWYDYLQLLDSVNKEMLTEYFKCELQDLEEEIYHNVTVQDLIIRSAIEGHAIADHEYIIDWMQEKFNQVCDIFVPLSADSKILKNPDITLDNKGYYGIEITDSLLKDYINDYVLIKSVDYENIIKSKYSYKLPDNEDIIMMGKFNSYEYNSFFYYSYSEMLYK
jgi:hypothetical protein